MKKRSYADNVWDAYWFDFEKQVQYRTRDVKWARLRKLLRYQYRAVRGK